MGTHVRHVTANTSAALMLQRSRYGDTCNICNWQCVNKKISLDLGSNSMLENWNIFLSTPVRHVTANTSAVLMLRRSQYGDTCNICNWQYVKQKYLSQFWIKLSVRMKIAHKIAENVFRNDLSSVFEHPVSTRIFEREQLIYVYYS